MNPFWIEPDWPAPANIRAASTLRGGGHSRGVFDSLNLGAHVGDDPDAVRSNRQRLRQELSVPAEPVWLHQVHGSRVICAHAPGDATGDAAVTDRAGTVCAVMTADCLPILLCNRKGTKVAAVHAGWRGLAGGVVEAAVSALGDSDLLAWMGPAIGPSAFEVGEDVLQAFTERLGDCGEAFTPGAEGRWHADIYRLARTIMGQMGVKAVYGGEDCTYSDPERFFSYRRDGQTGRMATLIWRE